MSKPVAWSYSVLSSFETCPRRHHETRVAKTTPDPMGIDALLGIDSHKALELRARDNMPLPQVITSRTPDGLKTGKMSTEGWEAYVRRICAAPGQLITETQVALNKNLQPVKWFGKDVWVRGVIDIGKILGNKGMFWDWKTGKRKEDTDQLKLFAALGFAKWPQLEHIRTGYLWLPAKKLDQESFSRADVPSIWDAFLPRVRRLEHAHAENKWPEKPSGLCKKWCPVHHCQYNGQFRG